MADGICIITLIYLCCPLQRSLIKEEIMKSELDPFKKVPYRGLCEAIH